MKIVLLLLALIACCAAQFSSTAQQQIVDAHNTLRSSIAKGTYVARTTKKQTGANMLKMKWNSTLETSAQNYAKTCLRGPVDAIGLGENMYVDFVDYPAGLLDSYVVKAFKKWEEDVHSYGWSSNTFVTKTHKKIGSFTQMAWAETGSVGCGVKNCGNFRTDKELIIVVCQYYAPGNQSNKTIYTEGATCSACPPETQCEQDSGLCVQV